MVLGLSSLSCFVGSSFWDELITSSEESCFMCVIQETRTQVASDRFRLLRH